MDKIILGHGIFNIGGTDIALTRGGGQFVVEREYREIEADGDMGPVKGRITKIKSVAKLTMNALSILPADFAKAYPAVKVETIAAPAAGKEITGAADITDTDYQTVTWTGKTKDGKAVIITLDNAINLENFDWKLADKDEVVQALTYTATYTEEARTTEPWKIKFVD